MARKENPYRATGRVLIIADDYHKNYFVGEEYDVYNFSQDYFRIANQMGMGLIEKSKCKVIPMITPKDMKFRINSPEHSEEVQQHLFDLGVHWSGFASFEVMYTNLPFIFIGSSGWLEYTDDEGVFNDLVAVEYELQKEITIKHVLVPVEQRSKVMVGGEEYDEDLVMQALRAFRAGK